MDTVAPPRTSQQIKDQIVADMKARSALSTDVLMAEMRAERARIEAYQKRKADEAAAARAAYWRSWLPGSKKVGGKHSKRKTTRTTRKTQKRRARNTGRKRSRK